MPERFRQFRAGFLRVPTIVGFLFATALATFWWNTIRMPGVQFEGPLTDFSGEEFALSVVLERDVRHLAGTIGERNLRHPGALEAAARWIESEVTAVQLKPRRQTYTVGASSVSNIEVVVPAHGPNAEVVVVGAHYDSAIGTPGANDNGTGVASLLALARRFAGTKANRELRLVWFTNEEPPHFQTEHMGSLQYARALAAEGRNVSAMLSLETIGFYTERADSQRYPAIVSGFFPTTGNFLGFVGNSDSKNLVRDAIEAFRRDTAFPSEGLALSGEVQGVGWSDHWSFWQISVPAIMLTDTAPFRYEHYHQPSDTAEKVDYPRLARVVNGTTDVVRALLEQSGAVP